MRKTLLLSALAALAVTAPPVMGRGLRQNEADPARWAINAHPEANKWRYNTASTDKNLKKIAPASEVNFESTNGFSYLNMPDGSVWFVELNYDREVVAEFYGGSKDYHYTGIKGTVYDSNLKKYAVIDAKIDLPEGMERCTAIDLADLVTQKFFNLDTNYEIMFTAYYKPENAYGAIPYTYIVSLPEGGTPGKVISTMPGYFLDAVNLSQSKWSEDFVLQFYTSEEWNDEGQFVNFDIYTKASYSSPKPTSIGKYKVNMLYAPEVTGYETAPVMIAASGSDLYITVSTYIKPYFADINYDNPELNDEFTTPDNSYQIELYKKELYDKNPVLLSTTEIPVPKTPDGMMGSALSLGLFSASGDINFDLDAEGKPSFIVGHTTFDNNFQCETSFLVVNQEGKTIKTFGEDNQGYMLLSSVDGQPEQYAFVYSDPGVVGGLIYRFIDFPSFDIRAEIPCTILNESISHGSALLSMNMDRIASGKGYNYVFASANGYTDGPNTLHEIIYLSEEGDFIRVDALNAGELINLINPYINGKGMSPYIFNTDSKREYMMLVQRRYSDQSTRSYTELLVVNDEGENLFTQKFGDEASRIFVALVNPETTPTLWIEYLDNNEDKNITRFLSLPFNKLQGSGTPNDPYLIATPGDFALIKDNLSASYRLTSDIDFEGETLKPISGTFTGSLDGAGHTMRNFILRDEAIFNSIYSSNEAKPAVVNDLTLSHISAVNVPAILCKNNTANIYITGVHIYDAKVTGLTEKGFGGIVSRTGINTKVIGCSVNIDFDSPEAEYFGGIVGELAKNSDITACSVSGTVKAGATVGGIVGAVDTPSSLISDCHVNLAIEGQHTIGGIAGDASRSTFTRNVVEGSITATTPGRKYSYKENGFVPTMNVGGVIGELATATGSYNDQGTFVPAGTDPIVKNNVVALSSINIPDDEVLLNTTHRVIGRSGVNEDPENLNETWDPETEEWIIEWGNPAPAEACLENNHVLDNLAVIHSEVGEGHTLTEGASISADKLNREFFEGLGYKFEGYNDREPWHYGDNTVPELYFEKSAGVFLAFNPSSISLAPEEKTTVSLSFEKIELGDIQFNDNNGDFIFVPMENESENSCPIEIQVLKEGTYSLEATFGQKKAVLTITGRSSLNGVIAEIGTSIIYDGYTLSAPGCHITLYNVAGVQVAKGTDSLAVTNLAKGIYIASATDHDGHTTNLKIAVK